MVSVIIFGHGRVAELVDALDSKSGSSNGVRVRFPSRPPIKEVPPSVIIDFFVKVCYNDKRGIYFFFVL